MDDSNNDIELNWYIYGTDTSQCMPVVISPQSKVIDLLRKIKEGAKQDLAVNLEDVSIYRIYCKDEELSSINIHGVLESGPLRLSRQVATYWPRREELGAEIINILAVRSDKSDATRHPDDGARDRLSDLPSKRPTIDPDKLAKAFRSGKTASDLAVHAEFMRQQSKGPLRILNGRPFEFTALPVQLYHPVFQIFTEELGKQDEIPVAKYRNIEALSQYSQWLYKDEKSRWTHIKRPLEAALGLGIIPVTIPKCSADGAIPHPAALGPMIHQVFTAIIEAKNEIGTGKSDPSIQGAEAYAIYWSQEELADLRHSTCCPSFIIAMAGPWLCILGAVYLKDVVVQPLTDYLYLGNHPLQRGHLDRLTRVFHSLSNSLGALRAYYSTLPPPLDPVDESGHFPYIREFKNANDPPVKFTYEKCLVESTMRPVFKASTEAGVQIVVKFVRQYAAEAHQTLARVGFAPELLFDGGNSLYGGLRMIVMEYLDAQDLYDYVILPQENSETIARPDVGSERRLFKLNSDATEATEPPSFRQALASASENVKNVVASVGKDIRKALNRLHQDNLVFGDLRPPNILVVKKESGAMSGMLLDFDWCGTHSKAKYPKTMNEEIRWPKGVEKGALMLKAHDDETFQEIFS